MSIGYDMNATRRLRSGLRICMGNNENPGFKIAPDVQCEYYVDRIGSVKVEELKMK